MKKIARIVLGVGVAALMLSFVPTNNTASADSYGSSSNSGAVAAGIVVGGLAVYGIVDLLTSPPPAGNKTPTPAQ